MVIGFTDIWVGMTPDEKTALATKLGTSKPHLSHVAHGQRQTSPETAIAYAGLMRAAGYSISKSDFRPDLW